MKPIPTRADLVLRTKIIDKVIQMQAGHMDPNDSTSPIGDMIAEYREMVVQDAVQALRETLRKASDALNHVHGTLTAYGPTKDSELLRHVADEAGRARVDTFPFLK